MASRNASFHETGVAGALLAPLKWALYVLLLLLALLLAAGIVDGVFVFKVWPDGMQHLKVILSEDLARITDMGGFKGDAAPFAVDTAGLLDAALFGWTGIHDMGSRFSDNAALSIPDTIVRNTYVSNYELIHVAMIGTRLFGVRLALLLTAVPLVVFGYAVAMTDGLAGRAIRRARGGHESSTIYHRAKYLQLSLLSTAAALLLLLPVSVDPRSILMPAIAAMAVLARWQWVYYKKHL